MSRIYYRGAGAAIVCYGKSWLNLNKIVDINLQKVRTKEETFTLPSAVGTNGLHAFPAADGGW